MESEFILNRVEWWRSDAIDSMFDDWLYANLLWLGAFCNSLRKSWSWKKSNRLTEINWKSKYIKVINLLFFRHYRRRWSLAYTGIYHSLCFIFSEVCLHLLRVSSTIFFHHALDRPIKSPPPPPPKNLSSLSNHYLHAALNQKLKITKVVMIENHLSSLHHQHFYILFINNQPGLPLLLYPNHHRLPWEH